MLSAEYTDAFSEHERYLNFASYGPPSRRVLQATTDLNEELARGIADAGALLGEQERRAKSVLSRLSGFRPDAIALVPNTSTALLQLAIGLPQGSTVLAGNFEFPANVVPWANIATTGRISFRGMGALDEPITPDLVGANLTADVNCVSVSAVDFRTGFRADLPAIREVVGDRLLIVDAIQGFGVIDCDWSAADVLVAGGQKWMRGGMGIGFMAFSDRGLERISAIAGSWAGVEDVLDFHRTSHKRKKAAAAFATSNLSLVSIGAFAQALELIEAAGVGSVETEIAAHHAFMEDQAKATGIQLLSPKDPASRAGIAILRSPVAQLTLKTALGQAQFAVTLHDNDRIRVSMHATTRQQSITDLLTLLAQLGR